MKKLITLLLAMVMIFAATGTLAADITVLVNGEAIEFDRSPELVDDSVMVPFRFVAEKLGATVSWDGETQTVFAILGNGLSIMQIGNSNVFVNSEAFTVEKAPALSIDRTLVSTQILEKTLGVSASWNAETSTVTITK